MQLNMQVTVADLHSKILDAPPPPVQILSISCSFWENLAKSYVGAPWRVGAPSSGKSWIRHWVNISGNLIQCLADGCFNYRSVIVSYCTHFTLSIQYSSGDEPLLDVVIFLFLIIVWFLWRNCCINNE